MKWSTTYFAADCETLFVTFVKRRRSNPSNNSKAVPGFSKGKQKVLIQALPLLQLISSDFRPQSFILLQFFLLSEANLQRCAGSWNSLLGKRKKK